MNKWLFKLHSWAALAAFVPLLVICITGSVLIFKHEIDILLSEDRVRVVDQGDQRLSMDRLMSRVNTALPRYEVAGWVLFQDPARADLVYLIERGTSEWHYTTLDQYRGDILGPVVDDSHYLTDWLLSLHFTFLLDDTGLAVAGLFALFLCFLGTTGLILHRKFWKNFFTLRWKSRLVVYFSDLHKMTGVIASPVLLILGITGAWWNIDHFIHEVEEHWGGKTHYVLEGRLYNDQLSVQGLMEDSRQRLDGFQPTYILFPYEPGLPITFFGEVPAGNPLASEYSSTVSYDARSGRFTTAADIRTAGAWQQVEDSFRELHFGTFGGLFTRILWCLLGLAPLLLSVTGITLWSLRRQKRRNKKLRLAAQAV